MEERSGDWEARTTPTPGLTQWRLAMSRTERHCPTGTAAGGSLPPSKPPPARHCPALGLRAELMPFVVSRTASRRETAHVVERTGRPLSEPDLAAPRCAAPATTLATEGGPARRSHGAV